MTEIITYVFEFITFIFSFFTSFLLIKQSKRSQVPLGTKFLAIGNGSLGIYALSTIIYSLIGVEWVVIVFLKLGMIAILIGILFLFYTMQVLIHSSNWVKTHKIGFWGSFIIALVIVMVLIFTNYIIVNDATTADTHFEPVPYYMFALFVAITLIYSTISIYQFGIKKNNGEPKKNMQYFFIGLLFLIGGLLIDVLGNFIENEVLFDTLLFAFLSVGIIFITRAFIGKKTSE